MKQVTETNRNKRKWNLIPRITILRVIILAVGVANTSVAFTHHTTFVKLSTQQVNSELDNNINRLHCCAIRTLLIYPVIRCRISR